jgi:N-acetylglucosaminyldiphosphoundecaprenol N-acetyl-beta-D-mannosaminyltransferase
VPASTPGARERFAAAGFRSSRLSGFNVGRVNLFGIELDALRMDEAVRVIISLAREGGRCAFVVTPNVDHLMLIERTPALRRAYEDAALVLADGLPVVVASRAFGCAIPERVAGSDLVPAVFDAASPEAPLRVYLLGAGPGVAERAARRIEARWKGVRIVGTYSPPFGFERDAAENERILARLQEAKPDVLVLGLGAPKQEVWVHTHRDRVAAKVALCVGATIDFLAGEKSRAPAWMQRTGLEWVHRMASEPKRLVPRYASNAVGFPRLVLRQWRAQRRARSLDSASR